MFVDIYRVVFVVSLGVALASILYVAFAICTVTGRRNERQSRGTYREPVTILKPVCGLDPCLYHNLRSFCEQDYPVYQIVFGVRKAGDPAIEVIERVIEEFPNLDLTLVIDDRTIGTNFKVNNLANIRSFAKYDILVIADSDMRVDRHYLKAVIDPFEDPKVGAVTCLYKGTPTGGLPSVLAAMFINEWFLPSALVAIAFEEIRFCFGATMAVRVGALDAIGGFEALAFDLADDYMLGKLVYNQGYKVRLSPYIVENIVLEPSLKELFFHELRWARTVRSVRPLGYAFSFVTYAFPMSLLFLFVSHFTSIGLAVIALALGLRILLHYAVRVTLGVRRPARPWLVPIRDLLSFVVWGGSFLGRRVQWRDEKFSVKPDGQLAMGGKLNE